MDPYVSEPADIVLFKGGSLLARLIRWGENTKKDPNSWANHVGLIVEDSSEDPLLIESTHPRVREIRLSEALKDKVAIIFRPKLLADAQKERIVGAALTMKGQLYGYGSLIFHLIDNKLLGGLRVFRRLVGFRAFHPICSRVVADSYKVEGLDFGSPSSAVDPDQIMDFCLLHPEKYALVFASPGTLD